MQNDIDPKTSLATYTTCTIRAQAPFDWRLSLMFVRGFGPMVGEQTVTDSSLVKKLVHRGQRIEVTVTERKPGELGLRIGSDEVLGEEARSEIVRRVAFFLSAHEDLSPFYALAENDPPFRPVVEALRGLHHVKFPSAFEAASWAAINQRIRLPVARAMKQSLVREIGGDWAFPEADAVLRVGELGLREIVGHERKAATIAAIAEAFVGIDEAWLREGPLEEVEGWLRGIYGVGEFTSAFVLYRGLGRFVRQPIMGKFIEAAESVYQRPLDDESARAIGSRYGSWAGHWALYVWASSFEPKRAGVVKAKPARDPRSNRSAFRSSGPTP